MIYLSVNFHLIVLTSMFIFFTFVYYFQRLLKCVTQGASYRHVFALWLLDLSDCSGLRLFLAL